MKKKIKAKKENFVEYVMIQYKKRVVQNVDMYFAGNVL